DPGKPVRAPPLCRRRAIPRKAVTRTPFCEDAMTALPKSATIAVIGAGTMGAGIAQVAAAAGHPVLLYDLAAGAVERGIAGVRAGLDKLVERKRMTGEARDALMARIVHAEALDQLGDAALVIEAVIEKLAVKHELFAALEKIV